MSTLTAVFWFAVGAAIAILYRYGILGSRIRKLDARMDEIMASPKEKD